jgi:mannose PTS system EIIA component
MTDTMENVAAPEGNAPTTTPLIGVVVVTHGMLATELLNAAEMIVGDLPQFAAVSIGWHDDVETAKEAIAAAITHVVRPAGVIVLTDMFGGTPSNLGMTFFQRDRVEVVTGVNLPMLIKLAGLIVESAGGRASDSRRWPQRHLGRFRSDAQGSLKFRLKQGEVAKRGDVTRDHGSKRTGHARPSRRAFRAAGLDVLVADQSGP